ncbi:MAG: helix-turn-helix transcriptional regulator [Rhodothermaceae bacterium]|nr:helix-turn-helix transcriptional regulator [Rhodothermaceae bacterium]
MSSIPKLSPGAYYGRQPHKRSAGGILFSESHHTVNQYVPRHSHSNAHFYFVIQGHSNEYLANTNRSCEPGTLVYHPPEEVHANKWLTNGFCFCIELSTGRYQQYVELFNQIDTSRLFSKGPPVQLVNKLYSEFHQDDSASFLALEGFTLELLAALSRTANKAGTKHIPDWLLRAKETLDDQFLEELELSNLAIEADVHPAHLAKMFRRYFDCSPGEYLRLLRIEWASRELQSTTLPVGEVALKAGFYDQSHFSRVFRKHMGMPPGQFRKAFR